MTTQFEHFPIISTPRLKLIEITSAHCDDLFNLVTDEQVSRFFNVHPVSEPQGMQLAVDRFNKAFTEGKGIRWGISLKDKHELIGIIGFAEYSTNHRGVLAYALMPGYWNKGYLTEALQDVVKYGFDELKLNRIEAEVRPGNIPSEKVLLKNGFKHEGLLKQWTLWYGEYQDMNMYALLAADYT